MWRFECAKILCGIPIVNNRNQCSISKAKDVPTNGDLGKSSKGYTNYSGFRSVLQTMRTHVLCFIVRNMYLSVNNVGENLCKISCYEQCLRTSYTKM